jgi:L-gulono-1,4-lactone dehydrogenase
MNWKPHPSFSRRSLLQGAVSVAGAALLPSALSGCCACRIQANHEWNNALNTSGVDPHQIKEPKSLSDLVAIIRLAESEKRGVRMTGSGHSFSDVAMSEGYLLKPKSLSRPLTVAADTLTPEAKQRKLIRVESGMRLRELNPLLASKGWSLHNMGGYDIQTIVGAAMTGTHGSGLGHGPIATQIVSLEVVTRGGEVWKIEPEPGITDRSRFPNYVATPEGNVPARLVPSTPIFNAVAVSMGCMGVVYAVTLDVEPVFWLNEQRRLARWGELRQPGGLLDRIMRHQIEPAHNPQDADHYEVYFNPYPPKGGKTPEDHLCLVTKRFKIPPRDGSLSADQARRGVWGVGPLEAVARVTNQGAGIVDFFNHHPEAVPNSIDGGLKALKDETFLGISYEVFNVGPPNLLRVDGIEMAFDLQDTLRAVEAVFRHAAEHRAKGRMHSGPPSLRFTQKAAPFLAMQNGRDTAHIEMGMLVCADGAHELLLDYERAFIRDFRARPHWGLDLDVLEDWSEVVALYGEAAHSWRRVYDDLNGNGTFNARFTDRLGISVKT